MLGSERMRGSNITMYLWPGLAPIWQRGAWSGLVLAVGFTLLLNLSLATTFVWTDLVTPLARNVTWGVLGSIWVASAVAARLWWLAPSDDLDNVSCDELFVSATKEYLKGHWPETEELLSRLLRRNSRDAEARLMLATLLRRMRRFPEARKALSELSRLDAAACWRPEIELERNNIDTSEQAGREVPPETAEESGARETRAA